MNKPDQAAIAAARQRAHQRALAQLLRQPLPPRMPDWRLERVLRAILARAGGAA